MRKPNADVGIHIALKTEVAMHIALPQFWQINSIC